MQNIDQIRQLIKERTNYLQHFDESQLEIDSADELVDKLSSNMSISVQDVDGAAGGGRSSRLTTGTKKKIGKRGGPEASKKMSRHELMRQYKKLIEKCVEILILDNECQERIEQISINIDEGNVQPELQLLEEMLNLYHHQKQFTEENFSAKEAIGMFRKVNDSISIFIAKNETKVKGNKQKNKIWRPEKYNFNKRNEMCDNIRFYS